MEKIKMQPTRPEDALLTDAFAMAARAELKKPEDMALAIGVLSECAGSLGMIGGQVLDILSEQRQCTEQEVLDAAEAAKEKFSGLLLACLAHLDEA